MWDLWTLKNKQNQKFIYIYTIYILDYIITWYIVSDQVRYRKLRELWYLFLTQCQRSSPSFYSPSERRLRALPPLEIGISLPSCQVRSLVSFYVCTTVDLKKDGYLQRSVMDRRNKEIKTNTYNPNGGRKSPFNTRHERTIEQGSMRSRQKVGSFILTPQRK